MGSKKVILTVGDTFTTPTPAMLEAMMRATHGDSVYGEDETTNRFERKVADLAGKEAAVFCVSGTLSNQLALRTHLHQPPHSILCDFRAHVYTCEAAGLAVLSQAMVTPVRPKNGVYLTVEDVKRQIILGEDIHTAPTKVISLENTLGGTIMPIEEIRKISEFARQHGIKMHLDGARLWNASAATDVTIKEYCQYFDTVSLCISKGLGAPVGSVLVGPEEFIKKATWIKKQQGGGIRQAGLLAAAADVAIEQVWPTMKDTHAKAAHLGKAIEAMGIPLQLPVQTNFVFMDAAAAKLDTGLLNEISAKHGVKTMGPRIVLHHQITDESIEKLKAAIFETLETSRAQGFKGGAECRSGYQQQMNADD